MQFSDSNEQKYYLDSSISQLSVKPAPYLIIDTFKH